MQDWSLAGLKTIPASGRHFFNSTWSRPSLVLPQVTTKRCGAWPLKSEPGNARLSETNTRLSTLVGPARPCWDGLLGGAINQRQREQFRVAVWTQARRDNPKAGFPLRITTLDAGHGRTALCPLNRAAAVSICHSQATTGLGFRVARLS